ncbi:MAG: complex I NDUFA9 subunit family protein [Burkholderiaceae bacterium]|nr:complex I NDUFA9 subunit family protein [Burkholderiaceae bacterium]
MDNILILGGSGFVGSVLCEELVRRHGGGGLRIAVPTRRRVNARHLQILPTIEVVQADVFDDGELTRLVGGRDAVVNLIGILHGTEADFQRVHVDLPRRIARACADAGVARLVHVSALGVAPGAPSRYLRSKAAGEGGLREAYGQATVIRPSVIFGAGDRFMNLFADLQAISPFMPLAGAEARFQPVWVDDVARAIVHLLDEPATAGQTFECAGPRIFTLAELVRMAGRWSGHERRIVSLPASIGMLQAWTLEWLPGAPLMSRDNLRSMQVPNIATGGLPGLSALGITAADIGAVMPTLLARGGEMQRLNRWRAAVHLR